MLDVSKTTLGIYNCQKLYILDHFSSASISPYGDKTHNSKTKIAYKYTQILTYISMNIDPKGRIPPSTTITLGSINLYYKMNPFIRSNNQVADIVTKYIFCVEPNSWRILKPGELRGMTRRHTQWIEALVQRICEFELPLQQDHITRPEHAITVQLLANPDAQLREGNLIT